MAQSIRDNYHWIYDGGHQIRPLFESPSNQSRHGSVIVFYQFQVDSDDTSSGAPNMQEMYDWLQTDEGRWCKDHVTQGIKIRTERNFSTWAYHVAIYGNLTDEDQTYYTLKWG